MALKAAVAAGVPKDRAGILVDEQFGAAILCDAAQARLYHLVPAEKSGQDEFDFEYGEDFAIHIEAFNPTFCKVLVRYNPEGDKGLNQRQAARLQRLSDYLHCSRPEIHVRAARAGHARPTPARWGERKRYDLERRPVLMVQAIRELQEAGVEPDLWKIEGLDRREDCLQWPRRRGAMGAMVWAASSSAGVRTRAHVHTWLSTAAGVPGFIGFAVGRTTFWDPLMAWKDQKISREAALAEIAQRYRQWVDVFEGARVA